MAGKIYVYHHNDHDGIVAAGVLYNLYKKAVREEQFVFNMIDYNTILNFDHIDFTAGDHVFFLDYSFSNKHNVEEFKKLLSRRESYNDTNVVWIDHHKTSVESELNSLFQIAGIRLNGLCGAALTYMYLNIEEFMEDIKSRDMMPDIFHKRDDIPRFLKYIDDYDCWKHLYRETNDFHYGFTISNPNDEILSILLCKSPDTEMETMISRYISCICQNGETVQEFLKFENKEYHVDMYGFEYTLPEEHGGYKCFCMNRKGNSLMFGDKINEYDAVIPFYFDGKRWTYSMFSNKDHIDCSEVAKSYGGGGHKGAAGWTSDKLLLV